MIEFKEVATSQGYIAGRLIPLDDGKWQWDRLDARFGPDQGKVYESMDAAVAGMAEHEMQIRTPWGMGGGQ